MRYAINSCTIKDDGKGSVTITGPYWDDPTRTRTVTVKTGDYEAYIEGSVKYTQDAFPYLSTDDREFLISGMSPEGWEKTFGEG